MKAGNKIYKDLADLPSVVPVFPLSGALLLPGNAIWSFAPEKVLAVRSDWADTETALSQRLIRAVWRAGDEVIVQTPGYTPMRDALTRAGLRARAQGVDDQGLDVEAALARRRDHAAAAAPGVARLGGGGAGDRRG